MLFGYVIESDCEPSYLLVALMKPAFVPPSQAHDGRSFDSERLYALPTGPSSNPGLCRSPDTVPVAVTTRCVRSSNQTEPESPFVGPKIAQAVRPDAVPAGATPIASKFVHVAAAMFVVNHELSYVTITPPVEFRNCRRITPCALVVDEKRSPVGV